MGFLEEFAINRLRYRCRWCWLWYQFVKRVPALRRKYPFFEVAAAAARQRSFDTHGLDSLIARSALRYAEGGMKCRKLHGKRIAILASALHDNAGGHTKLVLNKLQLLDGEYEHKLFLTDISSAKCEASKTLAKVAYLDGEQIDLPTRASRIKKLAEKIFMYAPVAIYVYLHHYDYYGAGVLALLKRFSDIKIIIASHASHYPNYGISFADILPASLPSTVYINAYFRKMNVNYQALGMLAFDRIEKYKNYSIDEIGRMRALLGVSIGEKITMSGGYSYKFFNEDGTSEYFCMIKSLLERNLDLKHIMLTNLSKEQESVIDGIFGCSEARSRLIVRKLSNDYLLSFKCADVFIDSFPVSGAMTMIDLMRLKVPYVVKINRENALWSFHEYQRPNYEYMYERPDRMLNGVEYLLHHKEAALCEAEKNFGWFMENYEGRAARKCLLNMLGRLNDLKSLITEPPQWGTYSFPASLIV